MSDRKYIAFVDILGFKDLVDNNTHEELTEIYEKLFIPMLGWGLAYGDMQIIQRADQKKVLLPNYNRISLNSLVVSDSVILWSNDNSIKSFIDIKNCLLVFLDHAFATGFPLRGALVEGELKAINGYYNQTKTSNIVSTLVGKGLVEAYKLEGLQDWAGCVIHPSCIRHVQSVDKTIMPTLSNEKEIIEYDVPFKQGKEKYHIINWVFNRIKGNSIDNTFFRRMFSEYKKGTSNEKVEKIITNTLDYIDFARKL